MSAIGTLARVPAAAFELANIILTVPDAPIGQTPRDVVWTQRGTTFYLYRSDAREHPVPVLLVFALINRPDIFDLRPGSSFVESCSARGSTCSSSIGASPMKRTPTWGWASSCATSCTGRYARRCGPPARRS
jgi:poly(3-hydroxyalkanoate) synthetase